MAIVVVDFRLLGEFAVDVDGAPVEIGHARQGDVLVALLLEVNRPVSVDQLVDRVWGARPPQRPRDSLYSYLSRLRGVLSGIDGVEIRKRSGGYALVTDPMTIDVHRFHRLTARARAAEDVQALELFDEAFALWRGEPLSGLDSLWLNSSRELLERERRSAELDRDDVRLRVGRHAELVTELSADPSLDERRTGQLMLALYRCGRQAEALEQYERIRRQLDEELGAYPSPPLKRLHQRILTADPTLEAPRSPMAGPTVPRQLPAPPTSFTGRAGELEALSELMIPAGDHERTAVISALSGGGGVGKTWLALRWAHDHAAEFPDGQLYLNLRGFDPVDEPVPASTAVRAFLDALGVAPSAIPTEPEAQAGLYRGLVNGRRMLIVLDNARDTAQLTPLLPGGRTCAVLVTSRNRLGGLLTTHGARPLPLDVLDEVDARKLLTRHLGASRIEDEPEAVAELLRWCAGLPLALGIVSARAATRPEFALSTLAEELRDAPARLDALDAGEVPANLRAVFAASYRDLDADSATMFRLLGVAPGEDIDLPAASALAAVPLPRARAILRKLSSVHLVGEHRHGRYRMHDLVRLHAAELASTEDGEATRTAVTRLLDRHRYTASVAANAYVPHEPRRRPPVPAPVGPVLEFSGSEEARAWLDAERTTLVTAAKYAATHSCPDHVGHLATTLFRYLDIGAHYQDALALHSAAIAAGWLGEGLGCRAFTLFRLGRYDEALDDAQRAFEHAQTTRNRTIEAATSATLGIIHEHLGDLDQALGHFEHGLRTARRAADQGAEGIALNNLGGLYRQLGRFGESAGLLELGITIARETQNGGLGVTVMACFAELQWDQGLHGEAVDLMEEVITIAHRDGNLSLEVESLNELGTMVRTLGAAADSLGHHRNALGIAEEIHYPDQEAQALHGMACANQALGDVTEARRYAERALSVYTGLNSAEADAVRELLKSLD